MWLYSNAPTPTSANWSRLLCSTHKYTNDNSKENYNCWINSPSTSPYMKIVPRIVFCQRTRVTEVLTRTAERTFSNSCLLAHNTYTFSRKTALLNITFNKTFSDSGPIQMLRYSSFLVIRKAGLLWFFYIKTFSRGRRRQITLVFRNTRGDWIVWFDCQAYLLFSVSLSAKECNVKG
jgi:hypothetical protein